MIVSCRVSGFWEKILGTTLPIVTNSQLAPEKWIKMVFPQQQNAMRSLHNIVDLGVFWASWGGSGRTSWPLNGVDPNHANHPLG